MREMDIKAIIKACGGAAQIARHLKSNDPRSATGNLTLAAVCQWDRVPVHHCHAVHELSGGKIGLSDMRPDVWPREKIGTKKPKRSPEQARAA